jgi:hypothetical protein
MCSPGSSRIVTPGSGQPTVGLASISSLRSKQIPPVSLVP